MESIDRKFRLTGALIGLARATEGNEHLVTPETKHILLEGLKATVPGVSADFEALLTEIGSEKRRLIPNCYTCAAPCGKNNDFSLEEIRWEPQQIRELKALLLSAAQAVAGYGETVFPFLCKALIMLGITGYRREHLLPVLQEAGSLLAAKLFPGE